MKKYYQLVQNGREVDVYIYGDITSWAWLESDVSNYTLARELQGLDVDTINVHINSYGGEVAEGLAIYNTLRNHPAKVKTYCEGFACSIASVVFMAGDERIMYNASMLMIHNAWTCATGDSDKLRKSADDLEIITQASVHAYLSCVNIEETEVKRMLDVETWIAPIDALEMGFASSIATTEQTNAPAASAHKALFSLLQKALQEGKPALEPITREPEPEPPEPEPPAPQEKTVSTFLQALKGGKD